MRRSGHFGLISFVVYFILLVLIPVTHCHAADVLSESTACGTGHGPVHLPFFGGDQCREFHESGHTRSDEHHVHFVTDDQGTATRHNPTDKTPVPQHLSAIGDIHLSRSMHRGISVPVSTADFYQEAFLSYFSGLSPPLS